MKIRIEDNPYSTLYFDITYRCNMNCKICYNHKIMQNNNYDMSPEYFREVLERLPKKRYLIRLLGGEPTIHPNLFEFIKIANEFKHFVSIGTNGVRFANKDFIEEVKTWKNPEIAHKNNVYVGEYPFALFFDLSGGTTTDKFYDKLSDKKHLELKLKGIQNCIDIGIHTLGVTGIVVRDYNEDIIPDLISFCSERSSMHGLHFRTMAKSGQWMDREPYTVQELKKLVKKSLPNWDKYPKLRGYSAPEGKQCFDCCNRVYAAEIKTRVDLIEFGSKRAAKCWQRGYINDDFTVSSFFGRIRSEG